MTIQRATPTHWGLIEPRTFDISLECDDEPLTADDAQWEAERELLTCLDGCADTLRNALPDNRVSHVLCNGDFLADEADLAQCFAVLLQSDNTEHIAQAAYRLRTLLVESADGQEFVRDRAKELLDEEARRHDDAMAESRELIGRWQ
jgi:predicted amidohydrolase